MIITVLPPGTVFRRADSLARSSLRPPLHYLSPRGNGIGTRATDIGRKEGDSQLVSINGISFSYDSGREALLLKDLSLTIREGEVLGLVGPSGCGKSTLAQILCGIYEPSAGSIEFREPSTTCAMSFQQPERQFFLDTAYDEIIYGIKDKIKFSTLKDAVVRENMEVTGLAYDLFRDRDPYSLSGGESRRLAFAIVTALDTDLVIFDEPTCGLDEAGIGAFRKLVWTLKAGGKTVIIISHNSDIIAELSDRVALLRRGRIELIATPGDFFISGNYKDILSTPEVIDYQMDRYGAVKTTRAGDIFDLDHF